MLSHKLSAWARQWLFGASLLTSILGFGLVFDRLAQASMPSSDVPYLVAQVFLAQMIEPQTKEPPPRGGHPR